MKIINYMKEHHGGVSTFNRCENWHPKNNRSSLKNNSMFAIIKKLRDRSKGKINWHDGKNEKIMCIWAPEEGLKRMGEAIIEKK